MQIGWDAISELASFDLTMATLCHHVGCRDNEDKLLMRLLQHVGNLIHRNIEERVRYIKTLIEWFRVCNI